jgi:hypothetical protein
MHTYLNGYLLPYNRETQDSVGVQLKKEQRRGVTFNRERGNKKRK